MTRASILDWRAPKPPVTAEEWYARLHAPDCAKGDEAAFHAWLASDPRNSSDYAKCESVASMSGDLRAHHALIDELLDGAGASAPARRSDAPRNRAWLGLAAAAAIGAIALTLAPLFRAGTQPTPDSAATVRGEQRQIALADGSRIQLNTDTQLSWRLTESERHVDLRKGEAFFDVAKDPRRPFIVRVGTSEVRVVGTQFSVREDGGRLEVIVKEGKVDVVPDSTRTKGREPTKVELTPGKHLSYDNTQDLVRVAQVDPERSLGWRSGSIDFDAATLEEAVTEISRYSSKPLVIEDEGLRAVRLSGRFRVGDIDAFEFTLRERFSIEARDRGDRVALMRAAR